MVFDSFEFIYKQAVETTDAFLGMMNKDPSSTCCEDLQLRVELPHAKALSGSAPQYHLLASRFTSSYGSAYTQVLF